MPRVVLQQHTADEFYHEGPLAQSISDAGKIIGQGIIQHRKQKIEEKNAAAKAMAEANKAAIFAERQHEREADRQGNIQVAEHQAAAAAGLQERMALKSKLAEHGGVLGPFGSIHQETLKKSAPDLSGHVNLAKNMSPVAGRAFLQRSAEDLAKATEAEGYADEFAALDEMAAGGQLPEDRITFYAESLQANMKAGKPPGQIWAMLAKESKAYVGKQQRQQDWMLADKKATGMIGGLKQMLEAMPDVGVDPDTGKSKKQEIMENVRKAEFEWMRTLPGPSGLSSYREKTDPQGALAALQSIMFEANIKVDPVAAGKLLSSTTKTPTREEVISGSAWANSQGTEQLPTGERGPPQAARASPGSAQAPLSERLRGYVRENGAKALSAGGNVSKQIEEMLLGAANDLGVRLDDPKVMEVVRNELEAMVGNRNRKPARGANN